MLLQDHAARAAEARGEAVALAMGDERLAYAELETLSDRLAAQLADRGVARGDRVGLLIPKRPSAIVAMHAVLKAGAAYVPLDAESPPQRLARIVSAAEPSMLLAVPEAAGRLEGLAGELALPPVGSVEADRIVGADGAPLGVFARGDWDSPAAVAPGVRVDPSEPAHLLFTSGSTGAPKGVVITHAMVLAFVDWAVREFGTKPSDRISGHPPLHFDLSTFDIYATFAAGAELHLVPPSLSVDPRALARFIRERELTQWFSVPSVLTYMAKFDAVEQDDFPALERLLWCGEVLPTPVLCHWMRKLPHVRFTNLYGPTEATIASSHHTLPSIPADETLPVPIGVACDGEELLVLDERLAPVPPGEIGDLYIAGVGLSPGYWRDEEKTRAAFLPDPRTPGGEGRIYRTGDLARVDDDGVVHFLGRADSQIKSRGYRIELGEIESALNAVAGVRECAIVGVDAGGFEGTAICAAYVGSDGLGPPQLRGALASALPSYMLPARWLALDVLPKNQNGKIDRPALRERFVAQQAEQAAARAARAGGRERSR
ncbi:amino acid adenylation domain-containing protein [Conexibacter arvalis]|uniref:Amino acid adenylation domain-containing protein n=1 Tax=Conexibacter arvalis TaxID=912552 RepID=A0A840IC83_9ACTN|nr:amino acid adenylation domain-containing protein [Conexibacter arvalis]MBB4661668.1 amino acid adenylation domain-containing protein [Conexibacter arvalis]